MEHKTTETGQNFVVVGCGMVGVVLAIELKRRLPDCTVTLLDKRTEAEATDGSWTISLTGPGLKALSNNPALLEKIKKTGQVRFTSKINLCQWAVGQQGNEARTKRQRL